MNVEILNRILKKNNNLISFKKLFNQPLSLTKNLYLKELLPKILSEENTYYITDKSDGKRCLVGIFNNRIEILTGDSKEIIKLQNLHLDQNFDNNKNSYNKRNNKIIILLDCERIIMENNQINYLYFDILIYEGKNITNEMVDKRMKIMKSLSEIDYLNRNNILIKSFQKLSSKNYIEEIRKLWNKKIDYKIDGIIFMKGGDEAYYKTKNYKWKPESQLTIDFYCVPFKKNKSLKLCSGINKDLYNNLSLNLSNIDIINSKTNYKENDQIMENSKKLFPIEFSSSLKSKNGELIPRNIYIVESIEEYNNLLYNVGEFLWDKNQWNLIKIRKDRKDDIVKGSYYGNFYKIAENNFFSIHNPLKFEDLISEIPYKDIYFSQISDKHKVVRKHNSAVKRELLKRFPDQNIIMDLGSGKGQDLFTFKELNTKKLLLFERDMTALEELNERKYYFARNNKMPLIEIYNESLPGDIKKIINNISTYERNIDLITCNFAFHYLVNNEKNMDEMVVFLDKMLSSRGYFLFTAFDKKDVLNLIKSYEMKWEIGDKYLIQMPKIGNSLQIDNKTNNKSKLDKNSLFQEIEVLLPCSEKLMKETLIDIYLLDKKLAKKNIIRIESNAFSKISNDKIREMKKEMDENDLQFINLYSYHLYKRV